MSRQKLDVRKSKINDEIKRLQKELAEVNAAILANDADVKKVAEEKRELSTSLQTSIARIRELNKGLVVGSDELDRQILSSADEVRLKALTAVRQYLEKLSASSSAQVPL